MQRQRHGYTQNMEEKYITEAFIDFNTGRFLDIGAYDGITFSSTRKLLESGWSGVYVEPDPAILVKLKENIKDFSNNQILDVALGINNSRMPWFDSHGDMVGSISSDHAKKWEIKHEGRFVEVINVEELKKRAGCNFDFINIDVEGINWEVFTQFDWALWNPKCICVEYDSKKKEITEILIKNNYKIVYISAENIVAIKK